MIFCVMIPRTNSALHEHSWQWHLQNGIRNANDLAEALGIEVVEVPTDFPLLIPLPYLSRITKGDTQDPLLLQVLPRKEENDISTGFTTDPLMEIPHTHGSGIIHKYQGRILIITTSACAVNCRYCFRRHFPYNDFQLSKKDWSSVASYVEQDPSIREVILSGGDPLVMPDSRLSELVQAIDSLEQITNLRIHTRLPVVIPQRINDELLAWVHQSKLHIVFVIHANHSSELDTHVESAINRLRSVNVTVLNQSVLLKDVNDNIGSLVNLSWRLSELGVMPYYLHLLDKVAGAAHYDVLDETGANLIRQMQGQLPGYLVPKLVRETPGADAKCEIKL